MTHYFPVEMANPQSKYKNVGQTHGTFLAGTTIPQLTKLIRRAQQGERLITALGKGESVFKATVEGLNWAHVTD